MNDSRSTVMLSPPVPTILVAVSDDMDARLISYLLTQLDAQVTIAATLGEASSYVVMHSWSAIIVDAVLADGSGLELLDTLCDMNYQGAVLFLSTSKSLSDKVHALQAGADDYLVRPYEPAELLARTVAMMRRSRRRIARGDLPTMTVGTTVIDLQSSSVTVADGRRIHLTPNEFHILHYLATHHRRIVPHDELATVLFGVQVTANAIGAISVYVRRLRRKIEEDPDHPRLIVTIRGSGYRFAVTPEHEHGAETSVPAPFPPHKRARLAPLRTR